MDPNILSQLESQYGPLKLAEDKPIENKNKSSGIAGFVKGAAKSIASPFEYLGKAAIVNPAREIAATVTGNNQALKNANVASNRNLGLGDTGTNFTNGLKKFAGNTAQALLTVAAPEVNTIKGGAAVGAGFGGSSALAQDNSTLDSVINQAATGAAVGGGASAIGKIFSKGASKIKESSSRLGSRSSGIGSGEPINGVKLGVQESRDLEDWAAKRGMPSGHPEKAQLWAEAEKKKIGSELEGAIGAVNRDLTDQERLKLVSGFKEAIDKNPTLKNNPAAKKIAEGEVMPSLSEINDFKSLIDNRRAYAEDVNWRRNAGSKTPNREKIHEIARDVLKKFEGNKEFSSINSLNEDFSKISKLEAGAKDLTGRLTRMSEAGGGGGGIVNMATKGDTATTGKSLFGRFGKSITTKAEGAAASMPKTGLLGNPADTLALSQGPNGAPATTPDASALPSDSSLGTTSTPTDTQPNTPFTQDNIQRAILADVAANGGKNVTSLISLYNTFGKPTKTSASDTNLSSGIQSALASLDAAEGNLSTSGGAKGPIKGQIAKVPIVGQYANPQGHVYEQTKADTALQLAKALSGSSRAPQGVFEYVLHSLPAVTDTPEVAAGKLAKLRNEVQAQAKAHGFDENGNIIN